MASFTEFFKEFINVNSLHHMPIEEAYDIFSECISSNWDYAFYNGYHFPIVESDNEGLPM